MRIRVPRRPLLYRQHVSSKHAHDSCDMSVECRQPQRILRTGSETMPADSPCMCNGPCRMQAALSFKIGSDPPHMSFSAFTPTTHRGPSVFTAAARPQRRTPQSAAAAPTDGPSPLKSAGMASAPRPARPHSGPASAMPLRAQPVPLHASVVPPEAPQQGVWYNGAPFGVSEARASTERATNDTMPGGDDDVQLPQLEESDTEEAAADADGASTRAAGAVAEGIEGDSGVPRGVLLLRSKGPGVFLHLSPCLQHAVSVLQRQRQRWLVLRYGFLSTPLP